MDEKTRKKKAAKAGKRRTFRGGRRSAAAYYIRTLNNEGLLGAYALAVFLGIIIIILFTAVAILDHTASDSSVDTEKLRQAKSEQQAEEPEEAEEEEEEKDPEVATFADGFEFTGEGEAIEEDLGSEYIVLVDVDSGEIVAHKNSQTVVPPASMTKILALLVAVENMSEEDFGKTYEVPMAASDYVIENDCSSAGFETGEKVTGDDLLYGLILPSGADAAITLCNVVADGMESYVDMMNQRCEDLGISDTAHFTNPVGIYNEDLHCTVEDMAKILKAALLNPKAREVLHAHTYTTSKTDIHPEGISLSNKFLRRIEDESVPGEVYGAKTGYVSQSGNCAASYLVGSEGGHYICVTVNAQGAYNCVYSHRDIYNKYVK